MKLKYLGNKIITNSFTNPPLLTQSQPPFLFILPKQDLRINRSAVYVIPAVFPESFQIVLEYTLVMSPAVDQTSDLCLYGCPSAPYVQRIHKFLLSDWCSSLAALMKIPAHQCQLQSVSPTLHHKPVYKPSHKYTFIRKMYTEKSGFYILRMVFSEFLPTISMIPTKCPLLQLFSHSYTFPGFYAICRWPHKNEKWGFTLIATSTGMTVTCDNSLFSMDLQKECGYRAELVHKVLGNNRDNTCTLLV